MFGDRDAPLRTSSGSRSSYENIHYTPDSSNHDEPTAEGDSPTVTNGTNTGHGYLDANALLQLESETQRRILDLVDNMRLIGLGDLVSLPQLVVCGQQSTGKSSVLEAITRVPFQRSAVLCTRFATQFQLRRSNDRVKRAYIMRCSRDGSNSRAKVALHSNLDDMEELMRDARNAMGIGENGFSKDVLVVEITGPDMPSLTVVDLPGVIGVNTRNHQNRELVSELVDEYLTNERSIILVVIKADDNFENQSILTRVTEEADPEGIRSFGIITRPDKITTGSPEIQRNIELANNELVFLGLGWHVLRNWGVGEDNVSFVQRDHTETEFFNTEPEWCTLDKEMVGIGALCRRLKALLLGHINRQLPHMASEISNMLRDNQKRLEAMGEPRKTTSEQQAYLTDIVCRFKRLCEVAVEGRYVREKKFFGTSFATQDQTLRLRAEVERLNDEFAEDLRYNGHQIEVNPTSLQAYNDTAIPSSPNSPDARQQSNGEGSRPKKLTRDEAIKWVRPSIHKSRGPELPLAYDPLLVGELFCEQSKNWGEISSRHLEKYQNACCQFLHVLVSVATPDDIDRTKFEDWIEEIVKEKLEQSTKELENLLQNRDDYQITRDANYIRAIKKAYLERLYARYQRSRLPEFIKGLNENGPVVGLGELAGDALAIVSNGRIDSPRLFNVMGMKQQSIRLHMEDEACEEFLDSMLAFYEVARERFINNVIEQVIERQVLSGLIDLFSYKRIKEMSPGIASGIAGESKEVTNTRVQLQAQVDKLEIGIQLCRNFLRTSDIN